MKLQVRNVNVRQGMILLVDTNVALLGGDVESKSAEEERMFRQRCLMQKGKPYLLQHNLAGLQNDLQQHNHHNHNNNSNHNQNHNLHGSRQQPHGQPQPQGQGQGQAQPQGQVQRQRQPQPQLQQAQHHHHTHQNHQQHQQHQQLPQRTLLQDSQQQQQQRSVNAPNNLLGGQQQSNLRQARLSPTPKAEPQPPPQPQRVQGAAPRPDAVAAPQSGAKQTSLDRFVSVNLVRPFMYLAQCNLERNATYTVNAAVTSVIPPLEFSGGKYRLKVTIQDGMLLSPTPPRCVNQHTRSAFMAHTPVSTGCTASPPLPVYETAH